MDALIVPALCSGLFPHRAFNTGEVFWIGGKHYPRVLFRIVPMWSLQKGEMGRIGLDFMILVLLSALFGRVGVYRTQDFYENEAEVLPYLNIVLIFFFIMN